MGNRRALEQAKENLINHYLLVGLSEQMRDFIELLEVLLPSFFRGALEHFDSLDGEASCSELPEMRWFCNKAILFLVVRKLITWTRFFFETWF